MLKNLELLLHSNISTIFIQGQSHLLSKNSPKKSGATYTPGATCACTLLLRTCYPDGTLHLHLCVCMHMRLQSQEKRKGKLLGTLMAF